MIEEISWKIAFLIIFICYSLVRIPFAIKKKKNKILKNQNPFREKLNVFIANQGMVTLPLLFVFTPWLDSFNMYLASRKSSVWNLIFQHPDKIFFLNN